MSNLSTGWMVLCPLVHRLGGTVSTLSTGWMYCLPDCVHMLDGTVSSCPQVGWYFFHLSTGWMILFPLVHRLDCSVSPLSTVWIILCPLIQRLAGTVCTCPYVGWYFVHLFTGWVVLCLLCPQVGCTAALTLFTGWMVLCPLVHRLDGTVSTCPQVGWYCVHLSTGWMPENDIVTDIRHPSSPNLWNACLYLCFRGQEISK